MRRWLNRIGIGLWAINGLVVLAAIVAVLLVTQTNWGRRHVLAFGLEQLASHVHGYVAIHGLHGNLLTGARLDGVVITDSLRRPFLRADTLVLRYSLRSLAAKHLVFGSVRLVNALVVLSKPPREPWNFARIFPTGPPQPNQKPGFGSWVQIENMTVRNGTLVVRPEWTPPDTLHGRALQLAISKALSPDNRSWVVPVPGGYQSISEFGSIDGFLPLLRLADPDSANRLIDIGSLSMYAVPLRPPGIVVRFMRARTLITKDSLLFDSVNVVTPGSHAGGLGGYALNGSGARLQLALRPFSFEDARFLMPTVPAGGGRMGLAFTSHEGRNHIVASNMDLRAEGANVAGRADFQVGPGFFRVGPSDVAFANVDTRLIQRYAPSAPLKVGGTLAGGLRLQGVPADMAVSGWTSFSERGGPTSRLLADGRVGSGGAGFEARGLRLGFQPLYLSLLRGYAPKVPYRGRVTGDATLTGSSTTGFALAANLVDDDPAAGRSHLLAHGRVTPRSGLTARDLTLRFAPLQVALLRPVVPKLPYGGTITGTTTLNGSTRTRMDVAADLVHQSASTGRSHVTANGGVQLAGGVAARDMKLRFEPLQMALVRPFAPKLPYGGTLSGTTTLTGNAAGLDIVADVTHVDPRFGRSRFGANGRIAFKAGVTADHLRLRFDPVQVALARPFVKNLPYAGVVTGTATVTGSPQSSVDVVADLVHVDPTIGRSHVTADGRVRLAGGFAARGLRLGFDPLQLAAMKPFDPSLPVEGTLLGHTDVTFSAPQKQLAAILDLEHNGPTGYTHLVGNADATWRSPGFFDVNVRAPALSLTTLGAFAPSSGLHGEASGDIVARGNLANLTTDVQLTLANGGGSMHTRGVFDLAATQKAYDFTSTFAAFNAGAASTHAPQTSLTGTLAARGSGTDPATANATLSANLIDSRYAGSPRADTTVVQARLADGLATFDQGHIRMGSAAADLAGSFGLVAGRNGTLRYSLSVDTISQFASHIPVDTGTVQPRPVLAARRLALARADSLRLAQATEVQRAAVGYPPAPGMPTVDTLPFRRDTLAGSFSSQGTLTGNIKQFNAQGTAQARSFAFGANYVGKGAATYSLVGYGTPNPLLHLDAFGDTVALGGFAFDSAHARVNYNGLSATGHGDADVALFQDPHREYRVQSSFDLAANRKVVALNSLFLRFDTTQWTSAHPSVLSWAQGITVQDLDLTSNHGGYLRANGRVPLNGPGDLRLDAEGVQLGDITGLLQDTTSATGVLGLHARVQGTSTAPVLAGTAALAQATYGGKPFPDTHLALNYAGARLTSHADFFHGSTLLAVADAHLPVNLAFSGVTGPRLNRAAPMDATLVADSLPLEALPSFTSAVSDVRGRVRGNLAVRGTFDHPSTTGTMLLDLGSMRVNSAGVLFTDITGQLRLHGDSAYVDSLVAHSGGPVRVTGAIGLAQLSRPSFNLRVSANDATVVDNQYGRIRADANLRVHGPYTGLSINGNANVLGGVIYAPEMQSQHATNLEDPTLSGALVQDTAGTGGLLLPPPNPLLQNLNLNVAVTVQPDTWVRNSQANVEIYTDPEVGPLRIRMNNARQQMTALGTIASDRGEYTYSGRVFQLSTGSATFLGGPTFDPLLQLSALYQVQRQGLEALTIQIQVDGTLSRPRVTLASNAQPPLSQSDLLSYLAFGQPASSLLSLQSSSTVGGVGQGGLTGIPALAEQQLASLAIGAMVDQAVSDIQEQGTRAGLDVFRIHPGQLPPEAAFQGVFQNFFTGTEFEAGKYVTPNLFAEVRGRASTLPGLAFDYRTRFGFVWRTTWEPQYLPIAPSFSTVQTASQVRAFGTFLLWNRRF